jgi:membrane associated rhomboid family serine protease
VLPLKDVIPPARTPLLSRVLLTLGTIGLPIVWWQERIDGMAAFYFVVNLLYLCVFADNVEDRLGRTRFACIVLGSTLAGVAAMTMLATETRNHGVVEGAFWSMNGGAPWFSASVAGIIGAYVALYPNSRVLMLVPVPLDAHEMPAPFFVALYFILHVAGTLTTLAPAVAGFVAGGCLCLGLKRPLAW